MGVKKLTTFVDSDFVRWRCGEEVHGKLVVDGNSLVHSLHTMEWSNGGQYREYRSAVRQFYLKLLNSGITPIVIFDGVNDEQKTDVVMKRRQDWVNFIHKQITDNASRCIKCVRRILPPLCSEVYRMTLYDLGIDFYVADGEADIVIARVANHYSCPVLSTDSDFFVFRLIGGYIPYSNFHWKSFVIRADIYHRDEFAMQFGFKDSSLLNVIPAIVGNDFISPCSRPFMPNEIRSICRYLRQFSSLEEYLASTSSSSHELKCRQAKQWYEIPDSLSCEELVETTQLRPKYGSQFPQWLVELFHRGHIPSAALDAAIHCKAIFRMIPDNFHKESSIVAGQIIRQQIYSLLGCDEVIEFFRHKLNISGVRVSSGSYNSVTLASVESMTNEERQTLFCSVCKCDERALSHLTGQYSDWKFVATTVRLWISTTEPSEKLVKALLLCFTLCSGLNDVRLNSLRHKYRMPITFRKSQRWLDALHSFMQWQVIYHTAWTLNALLKEPMIVFSPAYLYDGEIIMYLASAENIDQLIFSFVPYQDRILHRYLEKSVLDIPSQETQQMVVIPTTEHIFMAPAENLDVVRHCRTEENFKTVVDCHHSQSHAVHQQSDAADNVCTPPVPPENLQTSKHDVETRDSIQLIESETVHNDLNPGMIKPLTTSSISVDQVKSQMNTDQKAATATKPKKRSRRKRQANKDSYAGQQSRAGQNHSPGQQSKSGQTHPQGQQSKPGQIHPPGQQSKPVQTHPPGQQSKPVQTHLPGQQSKAVQTHLPGQQSKAGQTHPQRHKSKIGQARPPGQQSKAGQTHPPGQQSKPGQTHLPGQQPKADQTHPQEQQSKASQTRTPGQQSTGQQSKPGQTHPPGQQSKPGQTHPPGQQSKPGQTHPPGQQSKPGQTHPPGQQSKPVQTHPPGQQSKPVQTHLPGQQSKAGQTHPPRHKSKIGQARPPGQQLKPGQTHPPGQQSKPGQTHPPGQQSKSGQTHLPGQQSKPGQTHPPGQQSKPGQTHPPGQQSKPDQTHLPGQQSKPVQTHPPGQQSKPGQTHPPGQQSKPGQTHPPGQQSKPDQTHLPGQQSKPVQTHPPGQQSKAGQTHPQRHKSKIGQAHPPGQQSKADQTHPQEQQSKASQTHTPGQQSKVGQTHLSGQKSNESQTHPGNQQTKARQTHPSKSSQVASQNGNLQPQITAEIAKAENSVTTIISVDNLLPYYAQSSRTAQDNASPTLSAVKPRRKKRVSHSGVKTNGMQATNQTQTKTSPGPPQGQLKTVHSEQLSQQGGDSAQMSMSQKKVRKRRRPRCTTAATHDDTQTETSKKQPPSHSQSHKEKEDTIPERNHHDTATGSSTTEHCFTSANLSPPQTLQTLTETVKRQHRSVKKYKPTFEVLYRI